MADLLGVTITQALQNSWWEIAAVVLGIAYLVLAMRENILYWNFSCHILGREPLYGVGATNLLSWHGDLRLVPVAKGPYR